MPLYLATKTVEVMYWCETADEEARKRARHRAFYDSECDGGAVERAGRESEIASEEEVPSAWRGAIPYGRRDDSTVEDILKARP